MENRMMLPIFFQAVSGHLRCPVEPSAVRYPQPLPSFVFTHSVQWPASRQLHALTGFSTLPFHLKKRGSVYFLFFYHKVNA